MCFKVLEIGVFCLFVSTKTTKDNYQHNYVFIPFWEHFFFTFLLSSDKTALSGAAIRGSSFLWPLSHYQVSGGARILLTSRRGWDTPHLQVGLGHSSTSRQGWDTPHLQAGLVYAFSFIALPLLDISPSLSPKSTQLQVRQCHSK